MHRKQFPFILGIISALFISSCLTNNSSYTAATNYINIDYREPLQEPPMGLSVDEVPMFVGIGFDDNSYVEGLKWINDYSINLTNSDGTPVRFTFFNNGMYSEMAGAEWKQLYDNGHEIGNHSYSHPHGSKTDWSKTPATYKVLMTKDQWYKEIVNTDKEFIYLGIPVDEVTGFRNPFLEYTDPVYKAIASRRFVYDCSIEEGHQSYMDGTNYYWPYTLDNGSPGNITVSKSVPTRDPIGNYPGLWELPVYLLIIPSDDLADEYNFPPGLRKKVNAVKPYIKGADWKITGIDYNLWFTNSGIDMLNGREFLAILKYNLNLRLQGNKAPFMFGAHIDYYNTEEKREAIQAFIEYALSKDGVHFTTFNNILQWLKKPVAIN